MELVFRPGEPRIRLLQWLFTKFDAKLKDILDPQCAPLDTKMDSRIQRLLFVASNLGMCKSTDADLIRGVTTGSRQTLFMDQLLDLVCVADACDDPLYLSAFAPHAHRQSHGLDVQFSADCRLIDTLCAKHRPQSLFTVDAKLLPPDIMKQLQVERALNGDKLPDIEQLNGTLNQLTKDLARQSDILAELQKTHPVGATDSSTDERVSRTVRLVLSELDQLLSNLSYCYDNEMKPYCNRPPAELGELGPAFKRVHTLLQQFSMLLSGVGAIRSSHRELSAMTRHRDTRDSQSRQHRDASTLHSDVLDTLRQSVDTLEDSLLRMNSTHNSSVNTSVFSSAVKI